MVRGYLDFMVYVCEQQESKAAPITHGSNFEHPPLRVHKWVKVRSSRSRCDMPPSTTTGTTAPGKLVTSNLEGAVKKPLSLVALDDTARVPAQCLKAFTVMRAPPYGDMAHSFVAS